VHIGQLAVLPVSWGRHPPNCLGPAPPCLHRRQGSEQVGRSTGMLRNRAAIALHVLERWGAPWVRRFGGGGPSTRSHSGSFDGSESSGQVGPALSASLDGQAG
jgi:hypothetical protein